MNTRPFIRPVAPATWYWQNRRYRAYMLRELTCVLVAVYCWLMLAGLVALASDQADHWNDYLAGQDHPGWFVFHAFALVYFSVFQSMAWFRLAPKAMPLQIGETMVPGPVIVAAHYIIWLMASALIFWKAGVF